MKVDLNTATISELRAVGFGQAAAEGVIAYRTRRPYTEVPELLKTRHLGEKTYERVKDSVCVRTQSVEDDGHSGETDSYRFVHDRKDLLKDWDFEKNGNLNPETVLAGSHHKVWWRCERGHEWQAQVRARALGNGCPVCANRTVLSGENDLATTYPDLAAQWHEEKNGKLTPKDITAGHHKKVWWRCEKGHEWRAAPTTRVLLMTGCPACKGKMAVPGENDLASHFPEMAAQWDEGGNGTLKPNQVTPYSNRRVWWLCEKGHSYQAIIADRTKGGRGCPYCSGRKVLAGFNDLETLEPAIAAQWDAELNGDLTPKMVTAGSNKKVWWQCPLGHVWKAAIYSRTGKDRCGCPVCAGKTKEKPLG